MCGLTGFLDFRREDEKADLERVVVRMADTLVHRGPDDSGTFVDASEGVALGFRRLSIIDLSAAGHQPMTSDCGRFVLVLNGEIYNFQDLRAELSRKGETVAWRGGSDTEVFLASVSRWGLHAAVQASVGMFAFALWDRSARTLWLGRDRLGKKPLYYGWMEQTFLFGSELKAMAAHPAFRRVIDRSALALYARLNYVPASHSIYKGVEKLPPGTLLRVDARSAGSRAEPVPYWSLGECIDRGAMNPFEGTEDEAASEVEKRLADSVRGRMVADVPLGLFLSGGLDSTVVAALMQAQSSRPVKTFTLGLRDTGYDEAETARQVAKHLRTEHTELYVTADEARAVIPRLPRIYDEPFADSSQIPTFIVASLARKEVTVALSGDGGDEVFGGYNRYFVGRGAWKMLRHLPVGLRRALARGVMSRSMASWEAIFGTLGRIPGVSLPARPAEKLIKTARVLPALDSADLYGRLCSCWVDVGTPVIGKGEAGPLFSDPGAWPAVVASDPTLLMMYLDHIGYLPDDILVKVDRATMAVGLEVRAPLLDHRLVEFCWRLPLWMKVGKGKGKRVLRKVLQRYVPEGLVDRPKMGFGVPVGSWLRGPLRDWAEAHLEEKRLEREGFLEPGPIRARWAEHLSGRLDWSESLWGILMFEAWLEDWRGAA